MSFDKAVHGLLDQAARLSNEEAAAITAAAEGDRALIGAVQGAGTEGTSAAQQGGARRRSFQLARDANLLKGMRLAGGDRTDTSGGGASGKEGGGGEGGGGGDGGIEPTSATGGSGVDAGSASQLEVSRLRSQLAQLEEQMRYRLDEAAAAAARASDDRRRDAAEARRWSSQLEARLEQAVAALELERDESLRLEAEVVQLRANAEAAADGDSGAGTQASERRPPFVSRTSVGMVGGATASSRTSSRTPHAAVSSQRGASSAAAPSTTPSRRVARARAMASTPVLTPALAIDAPQPSTSAPPPLVVGQASRPEDTVLRPAPTLVSRKASSPTVSFARTPASPRMEAMAMWSPQAQQKERPSRAATGTFQSRSSPSRRKQGKAKVV